MAIHEHTLICEQCGTTFSLYLDRSSVPENRGRFCTIRCANQRQRKRRPADERFWLKVNKDGPVPPLRPELGPCWLWTGNVAGGYGRFRPTPTGKTNAHQWSYRSLVGQIPAGLQLDHLCRVRVCVNPAHLEPVTNKENALRGEGPTAQNAQKTHCKHGHPFSEANTYFYPNTRKRMCRMCWRRLKVEYNNRRRDHSTIGTQ